MTTYFVTRHPGAVDWAATEGLIVDIQAAHLDPQIIQAGDTVIGTLPIHLAAQVCARGGRYLHLSMEIPEEARGRELTVADLRQFGARLEAYQVIPASAD
ncbi:MAG: CRISPR-associated protein Csx16 [Candidatus Competibacteraceae bacterium]|nr:CRISPR-associated protein Csx16 [Candidatus Competibacteraceae bacterium]MCB1820680.1 CRISPR-associated protein Csx16 [Candidatus Competibacteraceae bacterium]